MRQFDAGRIGGACVPPKRRKSNTTVGQTVTDDARIEHLSLPAVHLADEEIEARAEQEASRTRKDHYYRVMDRLVSKQGDMVIYGEHVPNFPEISHLKINPNGTAVIRVPRFARHIESKIFMAEMLGHKVLHSHPANDAAIFFITDKETVRSEPLRCWEIFEECRRQATLFADRFLLTDEMMAVLLPRYQENIRTLASRLFLPVQLVKRRQTEWRNRGGAARMAPL